tara:strand:+ start:990 stop:1493 length:504 start_codon:yes stop_codon:yes gene_type:complete
MSAENILKAIEDDNLIGAKELINQQLYKMAGDAIQSKKEEVTVLTKEAKKAPVTKKDDDGEGMDPVGHEDDDVDNDGDSDSSDKYLKTRRKTIKKAMKESYGVFEEMTAQESSLVNTVIDQMEAECDDYGLDSAMTFDHAKEVFAKVKKYNSIDRWANAYIEDRKGD